MERPVVLLVDDDPSMREILAVMFEIHGGFRIGGVAQDGFEAAMLACDLTPDVVVLDCCMPRWEGERAAAFMREHCPAMKIVAFSAVLQTTPDWADEFLVKTQIMDLVPLVESLCRPPLVRAAR